MQEVPPSQTMEMGHTMPDIAVLEGKGHDVWENIPDEKPHSGQFAMIITRAIIT